MRSNPPLWSDGWYRHAHHLASPNHGPRPEDTNIDLVVIHAISLPPGEYGTGDVPAFFTNRLQHDRHAYFDHLRGVEVSSHFFIRRGGELMQFVSCDKRAWHAGASSHLGRSNCNDFSIGIELEGLDGHTFEASQYETLSSLCAALADAYPIAHIAGHEHIAAGRKKDPGPGFDWRRLKQSLTWPDTHFPAA